MAGLTNLKLVIPNKLPHFGHFFKRRTGTCSNLLLLDFSPKCDEQWKEKLSRDMKIHQDFITSDEEKNLLDEVEKKFKRTKYQFDHWDDAIHGYRETEKPVWNDVNNAVLSRLKAIAFPSTTPTSNVMQHVHVLDLAENGHIKPHLDSVKFCGTTIAGISLLSSSVMRLVHLEDQEIFCSALLNRRSLYIMRDIARYEFNHEILDNSVSFFRGEKIVKGRRISVICRNQPPAEPPPQQ